MTQNSGLGTQDLPVVLVVEDHDTLRLLLCDFLEARGFAVKQFANAESADDFLRTQTVDFIVSDFALGPFTWTGVDLFDRWAAQYTGRFVLHTGTHPVELPPRAGLIVLTKPCDLDELVTLIQRATAATRSPESEVPSPESKAKPVLASDFGPRAGIQPPTMEVAPA